EVLRRALDPFVGRALGHIGEEGRNSPRTDEHPVRTSSELALDQHRELRLGFPASAGRELLAADLKQQRRHRPPAPDSPAPPRAPASALARRTPPARSRRARRARPAGSGCASTSAPGRRPVTAGAARRAGGTPPRSP